MYRPCTVTRIFAVVVCVATVLYMGIGMYTASARRRRTMQVESIQKNTPKTVVFPRVEAVRVNIQKETYKKTQVAVCTASKSHGHWDSIEMTSLTTILIPSAKRTITKEEMLEYNLTLYIAVDDNDPFWLKHHPSLHGLVKDEEHLSVKVVVVKNVPNRVPFNDVTAQAFKDGAEYIVRVNDDSEFITKGWITQGIEALRAFSPPNVGVVGPLCREGNTAILTHDMVHRTHLQIFETYYPPVFHNWWLDDWITRVYEPDRSRVLKTWVVKHHTDKHGTRYSVKHEAKKELEAEITKGKELIKDWIKHDILSYQKMEWTVVVSVSKGFFQMFLNWWNYYKKLYLNLQVYVFAEDEFVFFKLKYALEIKVFLHTKSTGIDFAQTYGSSGYKEIVSKRAGYILKAFESCNRVIYTDVDTIWKQNPIPYLVGNYDLWGSLDDDSYICTGFFAIIKTSQTISFLNQWNSELIKKNQLNQPVFNRLLKSSDIKTAFLSRNEFPSGKIFFSKNSVKKVVIIHNNFIIGLDKKIERFKHWGLWNPLDYDFSCVQFKKTAHVVGEIIYNLPQKLCSPIVENAEITDNGIVYNKSIQIDGGKWYWKTKRALEFSNPGRISTYSETYFSFVQLWQDVFQHVVFDTLPKVSVICELLLHLESYKIIVVGLLQQELMQIVCPISDERFVLKKSIMPGKNVIRPIFWTGDFKMGVTPRDVLNPLGGHVPGSKIIYLPRRRSQKRRVENEKVVLELLEHRYGKYLQVYIPKDNWKDDREVFKNAKVIIGPHGGALSNMVFAPSGTKIIEFIPLDDLAQNGGNERPCYMGLANALGFNYDYVNTLKFSFEGPMQVDLDDLKKKLGLNVECEIVVKSTHAGMFSNLNGIISKMKHTRFLKILWDNNMYGSSNNAFLDYFEDISSCVVNEKTKVVYSTGLPAQVNRYDYHRLVQNIKPKTTLQKKIDYFIKTLLKGHTLGVHLRRTDRRTDRHNKNLQVIDLKEVVNAVDKYLHSNPQTQTIFIATDDNDALEFMKLRYPQRITYQKISRSYGKIGMHYSNNIGSFERGESAIIDSFILSRCDFLILTASNLNVYSLFLNPTISYTLLNELDGYKRYYKMFGNTRNYTPPQGSQIGSEQVKEIFSVLPSDGNLLVWGLGNDSPFWHHSTTGKVIFIEDDIPLQKAGILWFDEITKKYPYLNAYKVHYSTHTVKSYEKYMNNEYLWKSDLDLRKQLPEEVMQIQWDVILVDAPLGCCQTGPGRYQSIYTSKLLSNSNTHVFIDDYERKVERTFSEKVFKTPPVKIVKRPTGASNENEQAHFLPW